MNPEYKEYAETIGKSTFWALREIMLCLGFGVLVLIILLIIYSKSGVFRREGTVWYNRLAKLWILYIIVVIGCFSVNIGTHRALYRGLAAIQNVVADKLFEKYGFRALMSPETRDQIVITAQRAMQSGQSLETAFMEALKQKTDELIAKDPGTLEWLVQKGVHLVVDRYENEILASVMFFVAAKAEGKLGIHSGSPKYSYEDFKVGLDYLKNSDPATIEQDVKNKLTIFTHDKIDLMRFAGIRIRIIVAAILLLLPLIDCIVFRKLVKPKLDAKLNG
jgi:hypothetical protein